MSKDDIKRKLTSRKFWLSVASFVSMLIIAVWHDTETAETISALIIAGATVIGYVIGEGLADSSSDVYNTTHNYGDEYVRKLFEDEVKENERD